MGAAYSQAAKVGSLQVRVFGQPATIQQEMTGIAIDQEDCLEEEDLNILTDSLSSMQLLERIKRTDFPLPFYCHVALQLSLYFILSTNRLGEAGSITCSINGCPYKRMPFKKAANALAAAAMELHPARQVGLDLDL
jgi:hypothetical protein